MQQSDENVPTGTDANVNPLLVNEVSQNDHLSDQESMKKLNKENENEKDNIGTDDLLVIHKEKLREYVSPRMPFILVLLVIVVGFAQTYPMYWTYTYFFMDHTFNANLQNDYLNLLGYMQWVQPGLGWLLDIVVVFGERRRALFIVACVIQIITYAIYAGKPTCLVGYTRFFALYLTSQLLLEIQYLTVDALVVEVAQKHQRIYGESLASIATTMSLFIAYRCLGTAIAIAVYYGCQAKMATQRCNYITIASHVLSLILVLLASTDLFKPMPDYWNVRRRCMHGYDKLKRSFDFHNYRNAGFYTLLVAVFLFIYQIVPDMNSPYASVTYGVAYPTSVAKWHDGVMSTFQELAMMCGAAGFALYMDYRAREEYKGGRKVTTFFIFAVCNLSYCIPYVFHCLTVSGITNNLWHFEQWKWIIFETVICGIFTEIALLPQGIMAAWCSPRWFEATTFSILSVAASGGSKVGSVLSTDYFKSIGVVYPYETTAMLRGFIISLFLRGTFFVLLFVLFDRVTDAPVSMIDRNSVSHDDNDDKSKSVTHKDEHEPIKASNSHQEYYNNNNGNDAGNTSGDKNETENFVVVNNNNVQTVEMSVNASVKN